MGVVRGVWPARTPSGDDAKPCAGDRGFWHCCDLKMAVLVGRLACAYPYGKTYMPAAFRFLADNDLRIYQMKIIRFGIAILAALWTVGVAVGALQKFGKEEGTRGTTQVFVSIGVTAGCAAVTLMLFRWAIRSNATANGKSQDSEDHPPIS